MSSMLADMTNVNKENTDNVRSHAQTGLRALVGRQTRANTCLCGRGSSIQEKAKSLGIRARISDLIKIVQRCIATPNAIDRQRQ